MILNMSKKILDASNQIYLYKNNDVELVLSRVTFKISNEIKFGLL
jgi:hypothetical protein